MNMLDDLKVVMRSKMDSRIGKIVEGFKLEELTDQLALIAEAYAHTSMTDRIATVKQETIALMEGQFKPLVNEVEKMRDYYKTELERLQQRTGRK